MKVLGTDPVGDLAALKLEVPEGQTVPFLELGDSDALKVGDEALTVGNPFALGVLDQAPTFTVGIVSALNHTQGTYTECIVTDAEVKRGDGSGGQRQSDRHTRGIRFWNYGAAHVVGR